MSTKEPARPAAIATALFGKTRQAVIALLFGHPDESFYVREIVRLVNAGHGAVQRELRQLKTCGILKRRVDGNQVYYQANRESPVFEELLGLVTKTAGAAGVLYNVLEPLSGRIEVAFIYGSVAGGKAERESDLDVMVVGDVRFSEITHAIRPAGETLRREVNASVYPAAEFRDKVAEGHHFLRSVLAGPKVFLIGGKRELNGLTQGGLAHEAPDES